jgi:hypothetical protein
VLVPSLSWQTVVFHEEMMGKNRFGGGGLESIVMKEAGGGAEHRSLFAVHRNFLMKPDHLPRQACDNRG